MLLFDMKWIMDKLLREPIPCISDHTNVKTGSILTGPSLCIIKLNPKWGFRDRAHMQSSNTIFQRRLTEVYLVYCRTFYLLTICLHLQEIPKGKKMHTNIPLAIIGWQASIHLWHPVFGCFTNVEKLSSTLQTQLIHNLYISIDKSVYDAIWVQ